jgi:pectin methylesterase-like acyl-CoA thioesterase
MRIRPDSTACKPNEAAKSCGYLTVQVIVNVMPNYTVVHFIITIATDIYNKNVRILYEKITILQLGEGMGTTVITTCWSMGIDRLRTFDIRVGVGPHHEVAFWSDRV